MKQCPRCRKNYDDDGLNFCLDDGELLTDFGRERTPTRYGDEPPPTLILDQSRATNPVGWPASPPLSPIGQWQPQNIEHRQFGSPQFYGSPDQTIPTVAMILGILSLAMVCCYGGLWLGLPAAILGFVGMKNVDKDGELYGGRGMAIAGVVMGIITFIFSVIHILLIIFSVIAG